MKIRFRYIFLILFVISVLACSRTNQRATVSLNGEWQIAATGLGAAVPDMFPSRVPVPGFVDMCTPELVQPRAETKDTLFWYRRLFTVDDRDFDVAQLNILRSRYRTTVYLNGQLVGENPYNMTASAFDIKKYLKPSEENELIVRVGCFNNVPDSIINGRDAEMYLYPSGIYDDVFITLGNYPFITNLQTAPNIDRGELRVVARLRTKEDREPGPLTYRVSEAASGKLTVKGTSADARVEREGDEWKVDFTIPMKDARLWSPEDPFLYNLSVSSGADTKSVKVGMRTFRFDTPSGMAILNNKPYYLRGTNTDVNRFYEDPQRGSLPWDREWVTKLYQSIKGNYLNSIRNTTCFPPEFWYDLCDSMGILLFDEYDIWGMVGREEMMTQTAPQIAREYAVWMRERWHHPSVVVWDAQNETVTRQTGAAINMVRHLDIQNRPWDNGFAAPASETDCKEAHPYVFIEFVQPNAKLPAEGIMKYTYGHERTPENGPDQWTPSPDGKRYPNATIINEYGWLWLNRDGSTTTLTDNVYPQLFGPDLTTEQRREIYARHLGMKTEYWRETRKIAGILYFCVLTYSREEPRGCTSDNFIDMPNLVYEPHFLRYVRPAFCPVGLMIKYFETELPAEREIEVPVSIINDTYQTYCAPLRLYFQREGTEIPLDGELRQPAQVEMNGKQILNFRIQTPADPGRYELVAEIMYEETPTRSIRQVTIR